MHSYNLVRSGTPWRSGVLRQLPWLSMLALVGGFLCAIAAATVLLFSDGKPTSSWLTESVTMQPAVLLALFSAFANTLLRFALQEGCTVAWWVQALKGGDIGNFHRY